MKTPFLVYERATYSIAWIAIFLTGDWATAQEPSGDEIRVARLVERLGSDSYLDRDQANEELAKLGEAAQAKLESAISNPDPEIRLRAKQLLRLLRIREIWAPGKVDLGASRMTASKALTEVSRQTGNRVLMGEPYGSFIDGEIALEPGAGTFWATLDEICRQTGNHVKPHYDTRSPGFIVVGGGPGRHPLAYAGPVRAQIVAAKRSFTEDFDYEEHDSDISHAFQFDLRMMWEDRFRLVAYRAQPELILAKTDGGDELPASQPAASGWNVLTPGTRQASLSLRLRPPSVSASKLETLALKWALVASGDPASLTVDDLKSTEPHFQDDVEMTVENVRQGPGPRLDMTVIVSRDLLLPEPQDVVFQENEFELFDGDGRAWRRQGQTNGLTDRGARFELTFTGDNPQSTPKTLRMTYPRVRARQDLEIVFRNVPLPVARPD